jgi:hypothetical protein
MYEKILIMNYRMYFLQVNYVIKMQSKLCVFDTLVCFGYDRCKLIQVADYFLRS